MNATYIQLFSVFLSLLAKNVTPSLACSLREQIRNFQAQCYASPNPWDDALAAALETVLMVIPCDKP